MRAIKCVWQSIRPGRRVASPRSITCAPSGTVTPFPAAVIFSPSTTTTGSRTMVPLLTSNMRAARRATALGGLSCCAGARAHDTARQMLSTAARDRRTGNLLQVWRILKKPAATEYLTFLGPGNLLRPRQIHAFRRIHLDLLAFIDEGRHLHHQASLRLGCLGNTRGSRALKSRLSFHHREDHCLWQLNPHRLAIKELDFDLEVRRQVIHGVAQNFLGQVGLLEVGGVHEVVAIAVGVQEFHLLLVDVDFLDGIRRAEAVLEHGAGAQIAQFGLNEGAQVAGSTVLDAKNGMQIIVMLDDHAGAKLGRRNSHYQKTPYLDGGWAGGRGQATFSTRHKARKLYFTRTWGNKENSGWEYTLVT